MTTEPGGEEAQARRATFAMLAHRYEAALMGAALRRCRGDHNWAQDLVQNALIRAYPVYLTGRFREGANAWPWLLCILTNLFIGYLAAGPWDAAAATLGIFLPAFLFVAVSGPLIPRPRRSPTPWTFLGGINAASLALMAAVTWQLARAALVDGATVTLAALAALLLFRFRVNSVWLVLGGAGLLMN